MIRSVSFSLLLAFIPASAADDAIKGQRVFSAGHSFHMPMPGPLDQIAKSAKIEGHRIYGIQSLGGSTVTQHWNLADDKDKARKALKTGEVDVLTLSPHLLMPDEVAGVEMYNARNVPAQYNVTAGGASCGATLIWTK